MSLDIRLAHTFRNHRKRRGLQHKYGAEVVLALIDLWLEVAEHYPDGKMPEDYDEFAELANFKWPKKYNSSKKFGKVRLFPTSGERLFQMLFEFGFVYKKRGKICINDWNDHQPWVVNAPIRKKKAQHAAAVRWNNEQCSDDASSNANSNANGNAPYLTLPYLTIEQYWNQLCETSGLTKIKKWSSDRKRLLKARSKDEWFVENWQLILDAVHKSNWCRENRIGIEHALRPKNALRYYEGIEIPVSAKAPVSKERVITESERKGVIGVMQRRGYPPPGYTDKFIAECQAVIDAV